MKVLLAGATGMLGAPLTRALVAGAGWSRWSLVPCCASSRALLLS